MKIFITREIPPAAVELLIDKGFDVEVFGKEKPISKNELLKYTKDCDGVISLLTDRIDREIIDNMSKCRVIANYAAGYNNIDVAYANQKGIIVTNTPDQLTDATADIALTLILACARNVLQGDKMMRAGKFKGWMPQLLMGIELRGKTLGIVGAGRIGTAVAIRARAFGMNIVYFSRSRHAYLEEQTGAVKVPLDDLMADSDVISLHLPLSENTRGIISREKLGRMKKDAILVNTARGEIIDEPYLIEILKEHRIFSAGFDVYDGEPGFNKELLGLRNVVLLPHLGSATFEARTSMARLCAENIAAVLKVDRPLTPVVLTPVV